MPKLGRNATFLHQAPAGLLKAKAIFNFTGGVLFVRGGVGRGARTAVRAVGNCRAGPEACWSPNRR
jgi:hypothetical protein